MRAPRVSSLSAKTFARLAWIMLDQRKMRQLEPHKASKQLNAIDYAINIVYVIDPLIYILIRRSFNAPLANNERMKSSRINSSAEKFNFAYSTRECPITRDTRLYAYVRERWLARWQAGIAEQRWYEWNAMLLSECTYRLFVALHCVAPRRAASWRRGSSTREGRKSR